MLSNRAVNEINGGKTRWIFENANLTHWSHHWQAANGVTTGSPRITFSNFAIVGNNFYPRFGAQDNWSLRDDFTWGVGPGEPRPSWYAFRDLLAWPRP